MLEIRVEEEGLIHIEGWFDAAHLRQVEEVLDQVSTSTTVDLSGLDYISSAGMGALFAAHKRLQDDGEVLTLRNLSPHIREVLGIAGFDKLFTIE
jgi:anti-anti-sigma factor